jgi:hypothetical protein
MEFINWLVTSSVDPRNFSLTVKGVAVIGAGWLLKLSVLACGLGVYCVGLDADWLNKAVDALTQIAYGFALLFGGVMTFIGLLRKWWSGRWSAAV